MASAYEVLNTQPDGACRLADLADRSCLLRPSDRLAARLPVLAGAAGAELLSRSQARESHDVTLLRIRREDGGRAVLELSVADDASPAYGLEVVLVPDPCRSSSRLAVDDVLCTGRPETSVHVAVDYPPCG